MNLYQTTLQRLYLHEGLTTMNVVVYAATPQSAGGQVKKQWPEWTRIGKFQRYKSAVAFNVGVSCIL